MPSLPHVLVRLCAAAVAMSAAPEAVHSLRNYALHGRELFDLAFGACALVVAVVCAWCAVTGPRHPGLRRALRFGFVAGLIGFAVGFVGPMILAPEANEGPLVGVLITGPLGFAAGVIGGAWPSPRL